MVGWRKERRKEGNDKNRWMVGSGGTVERGGWWGGKEGGW